MGSQCYLLSLTSEHTPTLTTARGRYSTRFTYPRGMEGWVGCQKQHYGLLKCTSCEDFGTSMRDRDWLTEVNVETCRENVERMRSLSDDVMIPIVGFHCWVLMNVRPIGLWLIVLMYNSAIFHLDPIWKDGPLAIFVKVCPNKKNN